MNVLGGWRCCGGWDGRVIALRTVFSGVYVPVPLSIFLLPPLVLQRTTGVVIMRVNAPRYF